MRTAVTWRPDGISGHVTIVSGASEIVLGPLNNLANTVLHVRRVSGGSRDGR